ncbi:ThiF family adenylyltransferase [Staphylococcus sp. SQ8-PEA]|uniref:ThiF family adenylyltransferase n=1 Tax=Staphylococcus marylandisciuri TaxID=2981529 RepID=A0ABT2QMH3_9STAP|nr:ThiF family adenylyltransferase [Staphylococcus marylandisciuri]MCU5745183.1 ThiF family adenylyltransferase [Staphylococcus marylandisciuri]
MNERFSRQVLFKDIGEKGQHLLSTSHVLIIGMGALGTHVAEGLTRSGVGELTIVDRDYIELSNLQRQTLFTEEDAEAVLPKAVAAQKHLHAINQSVQLHSHIAHVDRYFLEQCRPSIDLIIDATDNFETRLLINDYAYSKGLPWIYGGVVQSTYVEAPFLPGQTPCFNCMMRNLQAITMTCDTVGVIQPAVTMTASLQVSDALKVLTQQPMSTNMIYGDIWSGSHQRIGFSKMSRHQCPTCGSAPTYPYLNRNERQYATLCGRDTVQYNNNSISQEMLETFLQSKQINYKKNDFIIRFQFKGHRIVSFNTGRLLIHNMSQTEDAISLINQLFG